NVIATYLHVITVAHVRVLPLRNRGVLAIVQPNHDAVGHVATSAALANLVADNATGHRAGHCRRLAAITLADLVAQHAASDRTDHGAQRAAAAVALGVDLLHFLHHAAVVAARVSALSGWLP